MAEKVPDYRVVAVNLHVEGVQQADRLSAILQGGGWPRATRSLVVREAVDRLFEELRDKSPDEVLRSFTVRTAMRAAGPPPRSQK
jgi:hypothetical protein